MAQLDDLAEEKGTKSAADNGQPQGDDLGDFALPERPKSSGRHTPKPASSAATSKPGTATPPSNDGTRSSDEKMRTRKSGESTRSFHNSFTPASTEDTDIDTEKSAAINAESVKQAAGGWWSTLTSTASAAVKQAEALAKEIQQNEEAQRWAEQVKGNVTQLRGFGRLPSPLWTTFQRTNIDGRRRTSLPRLAHLH